MGREIKRVALCYDFTIGKVWEGFLNPHYRKCPHCLDGETSARARLGDLVSLIMLSGEDSRRGRGHPYFHRMCLHSTAGAAAPSQDMLALTEGLAGREISCFGHDALDRHAATRKIIAAAGLSNDWGICFYCKGDAVDPEIKEAYENWQAEPPPSGEGYQLWETTTEGSPMTPVFKTPEELARHCAEHRVSANGDQTCTYETWLAFIIGPGWAPSMVSQDGRLVSGVEAVS